MLTSDDNFQSSDNFNRQQRWRAAERVTRNHEFEEDMDVNFDLLTSSIVSARQVSYSLPLNGFPVATHFYYIL